MPATNVPVCVPCLPMRIVFASPATPALPMSMLLAPVVQILTSVKAHCDVAAAGCDAMSAPMTLGGVVAAGCVARRPDPLAVLLLPVVLLESALKPLAVLSLPVVLLQSA